MKLYRFTGTAEAFYKCGRVLIDPSVSGSETDIRKIANKRMQEWKDKDHEYQVRLERLEIAPFTKDLAIEMLETQLTDLLIGKIEVLKKWNFDRVKL